MALVAEAKEAIRVPLASIYSSGEDGMQSKE